MSGKNDNNSGKKAFRFGFGKKNNQTENDAHVSAETSQKVLEIKTYLANPKAYVYTHNMSMASRLLTVKVDHHLQYKPTDIPVVDEGIVNWHTLEQCNGRFKEMRMEVEELQNQQISQHSLNVIAQRIVGFVTNHHEVKPAFKLEPASVE